MTLIVEDGTGVAGAESYISAAAAATYHANYGNTAWASLDPTVQEISLRLAAQYMTSIFRDRWAGVRRFSSQGLDWPRYDVPMKDAPAGYGSYPAFWPIDQVPLIVAQANAEYGLRSATAGPLLPDLDQQIVLERIGPITTQYDINSPQARRYPALEAMLAPVLQYGPGTARIARG